MPHLQNKAFCEIAQTIMVLFSVLSPEVYTNVVFSSVCSKLNGIKARCFWQQ